MKVLCPQITQINPDLYESGLQDEFLRSRQRIDRERQEGSLGPPIIEMFMSTQSIPEFLNLCRTNLQSSGKSADDPHPLNII